MGKVYLVIDGEESKFFYSWSECQSFVHHRSNVFFKGFPNKELALSFLEKRQNQDKRKKLFPVHVYTDGSFDSKTKKGSWAFAAIRSDALYFEDSGLISEEVESHNIDGEIYAVLKACQWMDRENLEGISLFFDYIGVERWAKGEWQAKTNISQLYVKSVKPYLERLTFQKVKAHQGQKWNEWVDSLAKSALKNKEH